MNRYKAAAKRRFLVPQKLLKQQRNLINNTEVTGELVRQWHHQNAFRINFFKKAAEYNKTDQPCVCEKHSKKS